MLLNSCWLGPVFLSKPCRVDIQNHSMVTWRVQGVSRSWWAHKGVILHCWISEKYKVKRKIFKYKKGTKFKELWLFFKWNIPKIDGLSGRHPRLVKPGLHHSCPFYVMFGTSFPPSLETARHTALPIKLVITAVFRQTHTMRLLNWE